MATEEDLWRKLLKLEVGPSTHLSAPLLHVMGIHEEDSCRIVQWVQSNGFKTWQALRVLKGRDHAKMVCGGDEINGAIIFMVVQNYAQRLSAVQGK